MARVTTVQHARARKTKDGTPKPNYRCEKCGVEIAVGDPYKWCAPRAGKFAKGRKRVRCLACPRWRPSETTSSQHLAILYGAQEAAEDALDEWDREDVSGLQGIMEDFASNIREAAESYRESATNIEDGFGHSTYQSEELAEKADAIDAAADEAESVDLDEFDEDEATENAKADGEDEDEVEQLVQAARDEWADEQIDKCRELLAVDF